MTGNWAFDSIVWFMRLSGIIGAWFVVYAAVRQSQLASSEEQRVVELQRVKLDLDSTALSEAKWWQFRRRGQLREEVRGLLTPDEYADLRMLNQRTNAWATLIAGATLIAVDLTLSFPGLMHEWTDFHP